MSTRVQPSLARWRRRKAARPSEILAAALACFGERGFAATRLEDVAARAGVTKGTLYLYFRNKEELFKAVVRQSLVPNIARAEALAAQSAEPSPALLERLLLQWAELGATPLSAIPKLILTEAGNFPDLARFYLDEVVHRGIALFQRVLRRGIERGEFRALDTELVGRCAFAPLLMAMLWRHSFEAHEGRALDITALCRTHVDLLKHGLTVARPEASVQESEVRDEPSR
ncbi:MAG TPA: TetR/AcrR family transcriptional regulator [Stellaceae bacterium]|nr:TetR/AcrR family transcriptional regulator [Stellaceae bacterium]